MKQFIDIAEKFNCEYSENELMSLHTSMKVGGKADLVIYANGEEVICEIVKECARSDERLTVLGNGSNVLVSDDGIRGVTLIIGKDMSQVKYLGDGVIFAQSGASLMKLCRVALENSLTGLEFAFGIPGNCGGAAYMNAGAYGGEMRDVLAKCTHVDTNGNTGMIIGDEMDLSYRHSMYYDNGFIITGIFVKLKTGEKEDIQAKMNELLARRKAKQPLEFPSAGSTFKRPDGFFAGVLIEECGLKGKCVGDAQVSEKHAGFLINKGSATCDDFLCLAKEVSQKVFKEKGVELEMEIRVLK